MHLDKKNLAQNKEFRFPIHKIDQTEKAPKNKICPKNK